MATNLGGMGRRDRFGGAALRCAAAAGLVLLVLGATLRAAGAETRTHPVLQTKEQFIANCKLSGGTVMEGDGELAGIVWCQLGPDRSIECNFNYWYCTITTSFYPGEQSSTTHGTVGGGAATDDGEAAGGQEPLVVTRTTTKPGTVLVLDDDERP